MKFSYLYTPHLKCMWMKNLITICFFHVDEFASDFTFSEKSLFWDVQYGRCVRGFWRHFLVSPLLAFLDYAISYGHHGNHTRKHVYLRACCVMCE